MSAKMSPSPRCALLTEKERRQQRAVGMAEREMEWKDDGIIPLDCENKVCGKHLDGRTVSTNEHH